LTGLPPGYPPPPGGYGNPPPGGYGYPPPGGYGYGYPPPGGYGYLPPGPGTNGMATASLICSLVGYLCGIGLILGIIFGFVGLSQIKQSGQDGRGFAITGIILGAVPFVVMLAILLVAFVTANVR
jgi:hypothetical protein